MSRTNASAEHLPATAKVIALLLASTPTVQDAQPGVLHQLLEFSQRYTSQVLSDGAVYAEHAGRSGKVEMDDVVLAVQARVGWEFGGRIPKEYILSLATQTNAAPLPAVPEVFGVRLPSSAESLTAIDFDLVPNKPPPGVKIYDEEIEEIEESDSDSYEYEDGYDNQGDVDMEHSQNTQSHVTQSQATQPERIVQEAPFPISAIATPSDIEMLGTPAHVDQASEAAEEEEEGLFAGGDDDDDDQDSDGMEQTQTNGVKRKLVEEEDYD